MPDETSQPIQVHLDASQEVPCIRLGGRLRIEDVETLERGWKRAVNELPETERVLVDLKDLAEVDGAGIAILLEGVQQLEDTGRRVELEHTNESLQRVIGLYQSRLTKDKIEREAPPSGFFHRVGLLGVQGFEAIRASLDFLGHCTASLPGLITQPRTVPWRDLPLLLQRVGGGGLSIVILTNLLIGMIVAFVGVLQLQRFGAQRFVTDMVAIGHVRELGPIITAIIISGRTGAGYAAELGTMKVSEEVDALRSLGFDPYRWLVLPRLMTLLIALPLLTLVGDYVGILGGMIASLPVLDMTLNGYLEATAQAISFKHFMLGLIKTIPFAIAISLLSCAQGLATSGGAEAVGERTTRAVVLSIFAVILIDSVFAMIYAVLNV